MPNTIGSISHHDSLISGTSRRQPMRFSRSRDLTETKTDAGAHTFPRRQAKRAAFSIGKLVAFYIASSRTTSALAPLATRFESNCLEYQQYIRGVSWVVYTDAVCTARSGQASKASLRRNYCHTSSFQHSCMIIHSSRTVHAVRP